VFETTAFWSFQPAARGRNADAPYGDQ